MAKAPVSFLNGHSSQKDVLGVISFPDMLDSEATYCRLFFYFNNQWFSWGQDFDFDCRSLTFTSNSDKAWWLLGKNGEIVRIAGTTTQTEKIAEAGLGHPNSYGYVNAIKNIDDELHVCGLGRQVYRRSSRGWMSIADDILTHTMARGFFDIDGTAADNLYAVGWHGEIFRYDGKTWHQDDSPTTAHLASVRCIGPEDVWIAGNNGLVLHGRFNNWQVIRDEDVDGNWYCVEEHDGTIYLAGNAILARIEQNAISPVDVGLGRNVTTHRLHSRDGILWSIGEKDVLRLEGASWTELPHPDNV